MPALRQSDEVFRLRLLLHGFGLVWQHATNSDRTRLVATEPDPIDARWDASVAALAEHVRSEAALEPPSWTSNPSRHLGRPWFAGGCFEFDQARLIATTPHAFRRHDAWLPPSERARHRSVTHRELTRKLKSLGCEFDRQSRGPHEIWRNPATVTRTTNPHWGERDLRLGKIRPVVRDLELDKTAFDQA